jgi:hypothetical protein
MKTILILFSLIIISCLNAQQLSKSFEFRYFTSDPEANGVTDLKGETEVFDTEERILFL